ncbi:hypothetical protein SHIRM173S_05773 [Streptomyces hirsutus]
MAAHFGRRLRKGAATTAVAAAAVAALSASQAPGDDDRRPGRPDPSGAASRARGEHRRPRRDRQLAVLHGPAAAEQPQPLAVRELRPRHAGRRRGGHTRDRPRRLQEGRSRAARVQARLPPALATARRHRQGGVRPGPRRTRRRRRHHDLPDHRPAARRQRLRAHQGHRRRQVRRQQRLRQRRRPHAVHPAATWAWAGRDGNDEDGLEDPNNIYDAALAAGHYLCRFDWNLYDAPSVHVGSRDRGPGSGRAHPRPADDLVPRPGDSRAPACCCWARHRAWSLVAAAPPPGRSGPAPAGERERVTA